MSGALTIPEWNGDIVAYVYEIICTTDKNVWYTIIGAFIALAIIRALFNGIKHALFAIVLALVFTFGLHTANKIKDDIGIEYENGFIVINNDIINKTIKLDTIENIRLYKDSNDNACIEIESKSGNYTDLKFDGKYYAPVKVVLKKIPIEIDIE